MRVGAGKVRPTPRRSGTRPVSDASRSETPPDVRQAAQPPWRSMARARRRRAPPVQPVVPPNGSACASTYVDVSRVGAVRKGIGQSLHATLPPVPTPRRGQHCTTRVTWAAPQASPIARSSPSQPKELIIMKIISAVALAATCLVGAARAQAADAGAAKAAAGTPAAAPAKTIDWEHMSVADKKK